MRPVLQSITTSVIHSTPMTGSALSILLQDHPWILNIGTGHPSPLLLPAGAGAVSLVHTSLQFIAGPKA